MRTRRNRSTTNGLAGGIVLLGLALAFAFGGFNLFIFFIALALASLVGSIGTQNPRGVYGGLHSFFWLFILALFFATHSWIWFLVGAGISAILGALIRPITAGLLGLGLCGTASMANQPQPFSQPIQPQYQPYEQGYQPSPPAETYQEGGQEHQYPPTPQPSQQYEQPQVSYPEQQMPPQQ